eukprot:1145905-Pelagomonas_calceolata.AAC.5
MGDQIKVPKHLEYGHERVWQSVVVQTWKPGKHFVWLQPEHGGLFSMLSSYACQVWGPRCAGSSSW